MKYLFAPIAFAICLGIVVKKLLDNKLPPLARKFGGVGLVIGALGLILGLLKAAQMFLFFTILLCTGLILAELRKEG